MKQHVPQRDMANYELAKELDLAMVQATTSGVVDDCRMKIIFDTLGGKRTNDAGAPMMLTMSGTRGLLEELAPELLRAKSHVLEAVLVLDQGKKDLALRNLVMAFADVDGDPVHSHNLDKWLAKRVPRSSALAQLLPEAREQRSHSLASVSIPWSDVFVADELKSKT